MSSIEPVSSAGETGESSTGRRPADLLGLLEEARSIADGLGPVMKKKNDRSYFKLQRIEGDLRRINISIFQTWEKALEKSLKDTVTNLLQFADSTRHYTNLQDSTHSRANLRPVDTSLKRLLSLLPANLQKILEAGTSARSPHVLKLQPVLPPAPRRLSLELSELRLTDKLLWSSLGDDLRMSYENLDLKLKICLLCLSILPEKSVVKKRALIYWWIGEGMVTRSTDKTAEEVGEEVFSDLAGKGLITPCNPRKDDDPSGLIANGCRVNSWNRRMLISVAGEAQLFTFDASGTPRNDSKSRRAVMVFGNRDEFWGPQQSLYKEDNLGTQQNQSSKSLLEEDKLLTVFNVNEQFLEIGSEWLSKAKNITALQLGRWQYSTEDHNHIEVEEEDFLKGLNTQKSLKYISLRGISRITQIPSSILSLASLEILDLKACHNLEELPRNIASLKRLTHLDLSECYLLDGMPEGIEKLSRLQVLKGFVIGRPDKTPCSLDQLANLEKLRRLGVRIGSEAIHQRKPFGDFKNFKSLQSLTISWGVNPAKWKNLENPNLRESMKNMSFPPQLKKLDIRGLPEKERPQWLRPSELKNIEKLYVRGGELGSLVHDSDQANNGTWKVEILRLKYLKNLTIEKKRLLQEFPALHYLAVKCDYTKKQGNDTTYEHDFVMKEGDIARFKKESSKEGEIA